MAKNANSKKWLLRPGDDGKRWSRYPLGSKAVPTSYFYNFSTVENPLSQNGAWSNSDPNQTNCRVTASGKCVSTQVLNTHPPYDDSVAQLSLDVFNGGTGYWIEGVIWLAGGLDGTNREIELRCFHTDDNPEFTGLFGLTTIFGYQMSMQHQGAYANLGRFKQQEIGRMASPPTPAHGDIFRLQCELDESSRPFFQIWWNNIQRQWGGGGPGTGTISPDGFILTDVDPDPYNFGNPSIGMYRDSGNNDEFGFQSIRCQAI